jgi:cytochrome P450
MLIESQTKFRLTIPFSPDETEIAEHRDETYDRWRDHSPVLWANGLQRTGGWLIISYDACKFVAKEDSKFSKEIFRSAQDDRIPEDVRSWLQLSETDLFFRDDPEHARLRGLLSGEFNRESVEKLRPKVNGICDQIIPELQKRGEFDVVHDFAWPVASVILTDLIGVNSQDAWRFPAWSLDRQHFLPLMAPPQMMQYTTKSVAETDAFLGRMLRYRRRHPTDDLITRLVRKIDAGYAATEEELIGTLRILGFAGFETTRDLLSAAILALLQHPTERMQLISD